MAENTRKQHLPSQRLYLKQRVEDFSGYTTLHGAHFVIGRDRGIFRRIFWLLMILTGLGFLGRQLVESFKKLQAKEHVITREIISNDKQIFPAITLCNANMMKKSKINGTDAQVYLDQVNVIKRHFSPNSFPNKTLSSSFDIKKAVLKYGHTIEDMIKVCTWDEELCSVLNVNTVTRFSPIYGLCHTFNSGRDDHPLLFSSSIKRVRGLHLIIDVNKDEYYGITSYFNTGIRMLIHDQDEEPMVEIDGFDLMPGHMTTIKIRRAEYISLPAPYKSACRSKELQTFKDYTQSRCVMECNTRRIIQRCGCRLLGTPNLPEFNGTTYCRPQQLTNCLIDDDGIDDDGIDDSTESPEVQQREFTIETILGKHFTTFGGSFTSNNPEKDCDCPKPCKQVQYKIEQFNPVAYSLSGSFWEDFRAISSFLYPTKNELERRTIVDEVKHGIANSYLGVVIHFDKLHTFRTAEIEAYDLNAFVSDVGGYLGLFLGCSILTIIEIFDFIVCYCFGRRRARFEVEQVREANERM